MSVFLFAAVVMVEFLVQQAYGSFMRPTRILICVDETGKRLSPNYLSAVFPRLLEVNGLRHIRFHDL